MAAGLLANTNPFIQVLDGQSVAYDYIMFPAADFKTTDKPFELNIGDNRFSFTQISLNLNSKLGRIEAELRLADIIKWNNTNNFSRSMGFYNFIPFMECYSQVCIMNMVVAGYVNIDGKSLSFDNGKGYVEKNWGSQFPISWLWVQSNNFSRPGISLSASIGHIPFLLGSFKGFLIGLNIDNLFYEFTSMNGSKLITRASGRDKVIYVRNSRYHLELGTETGKDNFILCNAPKNGQMIPLVRETLDAKIFVKLKDLRTGKVIFEDTGTNTGIEYGSLTLIKLMINGPMVIRIGTIKKQLVNVRNSTITKKDGPFYRVIKWFKAGSGEDASQLRSPGDFRKGKWYNHSKA